MAFNREQAMTAAAKFAAKGQHDRTSKEYLTIIEAEPGDLRSWLLLAEALANAGDKPGAIELYIHVGKHYADNNEGQKAIAVYRKVLGLDANRLDIQCRIAGIYKGLGWINDAVAAYEFVAQVYFQSGQIAEGLEVFRMVAELEPGAVGKRLRLAELYSREGMVAQAVEHFRVAAERLLTDRRTDDYIRAAERLIHHKEDDLPVLRSLAQIYLKQGENRRALAKLDALLRAAPADAEGLELLGDTFVAIGKLDKAVRVVMELAREQRKGDRKAKETAVHVLKKALAWGPENANDIKKIVAEIEAENAALPADPKDRYEDIHDLDVVEDEEGDGEPRKRPPPPKRSPPAGDKPPAKPEPSAKPEPKPAREPEEKPFDDHVAVRPGDTATTALDAVVTPDIHDELEELRFFISGRFEDDAQFAYLELQRRFPGHPALQEFADRFSAGARLASAAAPVMLEDLPAPATTTPSVGSAKVLRLDDDDDDGFLASIFNEPAAPTLGKAPHARRAVATLDEATDAQTFFDLGTAYREMGLDDDALSQFELAAKDLRWTSRARIMMASLRLQRGDNDRAVGDLEVAIEQAGDENERSEARYELGVLFQTLGDAVAAEAALRGVSPGYRDRDERLSELGPAAHPPPVRDDPDGPESRTLEVALPQTLVHRRTYTLYVLIRMPGTPTLLERLHRKGLDRQKTFAESGSELLLDHPVGPTGVRAPVSVLVKLRSSDFECAEPCQRVLLHHRRDTPPLTFHIMPCVVGEVNLVVDAQIEADLIGSEPICRVCVSSTSLSEVPEQAYTGQSSVLRTSGEHIRKQQRSATYQLHDLLTELFSQETFYRWIRLNFAWWSPLISGPNASLHQLIFDTIDGVLRDGQLDDEFFGLLERDFPRRRERIADVRAVFLRRHISDTVSVQR